MEICKSNILKSKYMIKNEMVDPEVCNIYNDVLRFRDSNCLHRPFFHIIKLLDIGIGCQHCKYCVTKSYPSVKPQRTLAFCMRGVRFFEEGYENICEGKERYDSYNNSYIKLGFNELKDVPSCSNVVLDIDIITKSDETSYNKFQLF